MMRSIRNDFSGERPHSECFIRFTGGQGRYAVVVRNELSREKFLAFQTDGRHGLRLTAIPGPCRWRKR